MHNLEVGGSNPPAARKEKRKAMGHGWTRISYTDLHGEEEKGFQTADVFFF